MAEGIELGPELVAAMVEASSDREAAVGQSGVVAVTIGKKQQVVFDIVDGRVVGPGDEDAVAVTVPTTSKQLVAFADGSESMARSYMMGDVKPVGSTGALLPFIELFEDGDFRGRLQSALSLV